MKSLVLGAGEIGKAVYSVLSEVYDTYITDTKKVKGQYDVLHICFPYSDKFIDNVNEYQKRHKPKYTVIHSTVPVGTSRKCGATHSPVRGMHPYLADSIKTFTKFVGGKDADFICEYFRRANIPTYLCRKSETTELGKILSTTYYAVCIEYAKDTEKQCRKFGVPFSEAYTLFNETYNKGWNKMGHEEYTRPILNPIQQVQGGHCTLQNTELLETEFTELVKKLNGI